MIPLGDLDAGLRKLEARITKLIPGCTYFFGGTEDAQRARTGPCVSWTVLRGDATAAREISPASRFATVDDLVAISARCSAPAAIQQTPDLRRAQLAASIQVFLAVSLAVHAEHQGYVDDRGWAPLELEAISEAVYPVEYVFAIKAGRWTPALQEVQPTQQEPTVSLE